MKKLGVILTLAFLAQGAAADEPASSIANLAVLVADTGASANWVTEEITIEEKTAEHLDRKVEQINRDLDREIEERFKNALVNYSVQ